MENNKTYFVVIGFVYEQTTPEGRFLNSIQVEFIYENGQLPTMDKVAERAIALVGDDKRRYFFVKNLIEKYKEDEK